MAKRTCTIDGCDRQHQARGMCGAHYGTWWKRQNPDAECVGRRAQKIERVCTVCDSRWLTNRRDAKYCSELCYHFDKWGPRTCAWPKAIVAPRQPAGPKPEPYRADHECQWCGDTFTTGRPSQRFCSLIHKKKHARNRRRGQKYGSKTHFTWAQFMRIYAGFDRRCAYCELVIDGQPEPDHVVPLSRGGSNSITNILPACSLCNADKRNLLLHEWRVDRERLAKPPRTTSWGFTDGRFTHLTDALLISPAA